MSDMIEANTVPEEPRPRRKGYYSNVLKGDLLVYYEEALCMEGLEDEIGFLRALIKLMVFGSSYSVKMILQAYSCLKGLCATQRKIFHKEEKEDLSDVMAEVFMKVGIANGVPAETLLKNPYKQAPVQP